MAQYQFEQRDRHATNFQTNGCIHKRYPDLQIKTKVSFRKRIHFGKFNCRKHLYSIG
jgi:hypothetical protein